MKLRAEIDMPKAMDNPFDFYCAPNQATPDYVTYDNVERVAAYMVLDVARDWEEGFLSLADVYWLQWNALDGLVAAMQVAQDLPEDERYSRQDFDAVGFPHTGVGEELPSGEYPWEIHVAAGWGGDCLTITTYGYEVYGSGRLDDQTVFLSASAALDPASIETVMKMQDALEIRFRETCTADTLDRMLAEVVR